MGMNFVDIVYSKLHLKTLPTKGKKVIQGPGENAKIDIGD